MIRIHITQKLAAKLPLDSEGYLPCKDDYPASDELLNVRESVLSGWHAHLLTLQRRNCVLFVHDETRFAVFLPMLTKPDFAMLDRHFHDVLMNALLMNSADDELMMAASDNLQSLCFDRYTDRSVNSTMTQMKAELETKLAYDDVDVEGLLPYSTSLSLSESIRSVNGLRHFLRPTEALPKLIMQKSGRSMFDSESADIIQLSDYRK